MEISLRKVFAKACLEQKYVRKRVERLIGGMAFGLELSNGEAIYLLRIYPAQIYYQGIRQGITKDELDELISMFDKSGTDEQQILEEAMQFLHNEFGSDVVITD